MNYSEFQKLVFEKAAQSGLSEYELYYASDDTLELSVYKDEISGFSSSLNASCGLRVVYNGHVGNASTSLFTQAEAERLVAHAIENAACMEKDEPLLFARGGCDYSELKTGLIPEISGNELADTAAGTLKLCREFDSRISDASTVWANIVRSEKRIDNSNGVHLSHGTQFGAIIPQLIASENDETASVYKIKLGNPLCIDLKRLSEETVLKATSSLGAGVPESGNYPVVYSGDAMSNLLSVFSAAFSGENAENGLSAMKGKENTQIANSIVNLVDNPLCEESVFACPFDGEGTPAYSKHIIENGELKTLLYDMATAARAGKKTTGNASRTVGSPISVSPSIIYIEKCDNTPDDLYAAAQTGVLITELNGLHAGANFVTGDFSLQSAGYLIKNGKKAEPIKSFAVAGNFYDMLKHIIMIADDLEFGYSRFASPSVLVDNLTVSGK